MERVMRITVNVEHRDDGGYRVSSDDLPGLILSGADKTEVLACIPAAVAALLKHKGVETCDITINATFAKARTDTP